MAREMLINVAESEECRIAVVEDGCLEELYVERASLTSHVGNIYKGKVVNIEGDPDHPISRGSLCSKGGTLSQLANSEERVTKPRYRAPNSDKREDVEWDWALEQIARKIKDTRDQNFIEKDDQGRLVNRLEAIAHVGSAALDNEECSILVKMMRALGLVYIEHQARI